MWIYLKYNGQTWIWKGQHWNVWGVGSIWQWFVGRIWLSGTNNSTIWIAWRVLTVKVRKGWTRSLVHLNTLHKNSDRSARALLRIVCLEGVVLLKIIHHPQRREDDFGFYRMWRPKTGDNLPIYITSIIFLTRSVSWNVRR